MTKSTKPQAVLSFTAFALILSLITSYMLCLFSTSTVNAAETSSDTASALDISVTSAYGYNTSGLTDDSYDTAALYSSGDTITVTSTSPMYGLYIKWDNATSPWTLSYNNSTVNCGTNGFVHEYIPISEGTSECTITLSADSRICDIYAYSQGTLPDDVQVWESSCDNQTDILVFSTHADDEILFLGGILALYGGEQNLNVQVVYLSNYWIGETKREHEKLDGLWTCGIRNYPVNSPYGDFYAQTLEQAKQVYDYDSVLSFFISQIRRFKPQVLVTQDFDGEYGHGAHKLVAQAAAEALELSMNADTDAESASAYGTWDVPKAYFHLYKTNPIRLDLRKPSAAFDGRTPLEVITEAYTKHVTQQKWDFIVSDDYEYSCAEYGLYRTLVGNDTGNDILENVMTYEEQAAQKKAQEESIAASIAAEQSSIEEASSLAEEERLFRLNEKKRKEKVTVVTLAAAALLLSACIVFFISRRRKRR